MDRLATQEREEKEVDGRREVEMALFLCRPGSNLATQVREGAEVAIFSMEQGSNQRHHRGLIDGRNVRERAHCDHVRCHI